MHISYIFRSIFLFTIILFLSCAKGRLGGDWSVPSNEISEGEGEGDIPAINNPKFSKPSEISFLNDSSTVIGIKLGSITRAYPLAIMDWHEVVNDNFANATIAITYSTLSGSSIAFDRNINGQTLEFRITGLLYNSNTILGDFQSLSDWSQMLRKGIRGTYSDVSLETYPAFEMKWSKWKQLFPESEVLNLNTGYNRPYGTYPYGDYQTDSTEILFSLPLDLDSLNQIYPLKEKMLGVIMNSIVKGYRFQHFSKTGFSLILDVINGETIIIIGSEIFDFMVAYKSETTEGKKLQLSINETDNEVLLLDNEGNQWTIFGENTQNADIQLVKLETNMAYWFSWATFYPQIEIYQP